MVSNKVTHLRVYVNVSPGLLPKAGLVNWGRYPFAWNAATPTAVWSLGGRCGDTLIPGRNGVRLPPTPPRRPTVEGSPGARTCGVGGCRRPR